LEDWRVAFSGDPSDIFEHLATRCNCNCVFCYNKGNPKTLALQNRGSSIRNECDEISARLEHYDPQSKKSLFPRLGIPCEFLAHPNWFKTLGAIRKKAPELIRIITNGRGLTPSNVYKLSGLQPIYLDISLNSVSPLRRKNLMRDPEPWVAIQSLPLLMQKLIPFSIIIVPWLLGNESIEEVLEDLEKTAEYAAKHNTHLIQISLPSFTRYFSSQDPFNTGELWPAIVQRVRQIRSRVNAPIVIRPALYEANTFCSQKKEEEIIIGVVQNSPAYFGGAEAGDLITSINNINIKTRLQARKILSWINGNGLKQFSCKIQRGNRQIDLTINADIRRYPSNQAADSHLGFIFMGSGLEMRYLDNLADIIREEEAGEVVLLTSKLMKLTVDRLLQEYTPWGSCVTVSLEIPENHFFGGNIMLGDLLVVDDLIQCINKYVKARGERPDLAVIPSSPFSLGGWGRDLTGRTFKEIERATGVRTRILCSQPIYD
jgi:DNA repair photolyase